MLVLVTGLLVTLLSWNAARDMSKRSEARRFEYRAGRIASDLRHARALSGAGRHGPD